MAKPRLPVELTPAAVDAALREVEGRARLVLSVKPKARKEGLEVGPDGAVVLKVSAPPVDGKANARVLELVAALLGLARSEVSLARGESSRNKELALELSVAEARARLLR